MWTRFKQRLSRAIRPRTNLRKWLARRRSGANLSVLDAIRILSTIWTISIHSYSFALEWLTFDASTTADVYGSLFVQLLANGTFSVDNFILLSGLLAGLRQLRASGEVGTGGGATGVLVRSAGRYLRLAPLMMFVILSSVLLLPRLECGPNWASSTVMFELWCRSSWPLNLLMLHNFIGQRICLSHSWYVAVDFQLFLALQLATPLLGPPAHRKWLLLALAGAAQLLNASIVYVNHLPAMPLVPARSEQSIVDYYRLLYIKPTYWVASYFLGLHLAARVEPESGARGLRVSNKLLVASLAGALCIVASNWPFFRSGSPMGPLYAAAYTFLVRPLWSLCLATLILAKLSWRPKLANLLSSLSRLTYSAYLLHPILMATFYGSRTETYAFSHYLLLHFTVSNIVLTYIAAFFLHLLIELPLQTMLRLEPAQGHTKSQLTGRRLRSAATGSNSKRRGPVGGLGTI